MSYRLGVDVGGTFTDLLLINEKTGTMWTAKVPSTPEDSSIGVFNGINKVCKNARVEPSKITSVMHGTTVATNTILTGTGAKVGLITTKGYRQVLQIARSFVPGGLGGWVIYNKSDPLAPLSLTIEADERISARGEVLSKLKVANDDKISIFPKYLPKLVSIPINDKSNSFSTSNSFSISNIKSEFLINISLPFDTFFSLALFPIYVLVSS